MTAIGDALPFSPLALELLACCLVAASGVPGLWLDQRSSWGPRLATTLSVAGCAIGLAGAALALGLPASPTVGLAFPLPGMEARLGVDALSALFALPVFLVGGLGSIFGTAYWPQALHPRNGRRLRLCYGLLLASMALITLARDGVAFLIAWEVMTLTNFLLVTTRDQDPSVRRAGWLYLLYGHATILGLFALFTLLHQATGSFALAPIPDGIPALRTAIFVLALVSFGIKAGAMPVHSWLPAAHASAPSHVSAVMSGVVIKMGIYGLVRFCGLFDAPPLWWGVVLVAVGSLSAFLGVVFALSQHDIKRLLAYHSIENIGIILLGLGLAMVGRSVGRPEWILLGLAGCLLHVWNHALFKSLLFLGAGSVIHATGTREIELTGGLARRMPATAGFFLLGAVAICGLPPLNGFVSELFLYLGLVRAAVTSGWAWTALSAAILAATGALAVACFVKVFGVVFLGNPRSPAAARAHEAPAAMLAPMAILALACGVLGAAPALVAHPLEQAVRVWARDALASQSLGSLAPLGSISVVAVVLLVATAALLATVAPACRRARLRQPELPTWACGYAASSPRLQYTASSFAQIVTSRFAWALQPTLHRPRVEHLFPAPARFASHVEDPVLDRLLAPAAGGALRFTALMRALPQGQLQRYILYIVVVLIPLLVWAMAGASGAG